jgi:microcin C transport system substrate-binding protein
MRHKLKIFIIFLLLALPITAQANDFGIAMHGAPLLSYGDHFSYANINAPQGGTLKQGYVGTFDTINPFTIKGKAAQGLNFFYDRLTIRSWDEPFTLYPLIAEKISTPADRSSITFTIDKRAKFNDRSPITAHDVAFSFEILRDKGRPNMRQVYKMVTKYDVIDDHTITFHLGADRTRESVMIIAMMPVLSKTYWSKHNFDTTTFDIPVSNGAYKIKSIDAGRRIVFEKNKNYWAKDLSHLRGLYNFDQISFDYFRDDGVAFEAFKSGDIDIRTEIDPAKWQTSYKGLRIDSGQIQKHIIPHKRTERMWGFIFNMRRAPFENANVRKALSLAIDRPWINKNLFHNQYKLTNSFFANSDLSFVQSDIPERDLRVKLKEADNLLKQAGWVIENGKRINKTTRQPLTFEILIGSPDDEKIALAYKRTLIRLGVDVRLRSLDSTSFRDRLMRYDYDMVLYFWQNSLSPGTEQALNWGCKAAAEDGRFNYAGICTKEIDNIVYKLPDIATREGLVASTRALDKLLIDSNITIPLFHAGVDRIAADKRIGIPATPALYGTVFEALWDKDQTKNTVNKAPK